jgi:hypothetical protein
MGALRRRSSSKIARGLSLYCLPRWLSKTTLPLRIGSTLIIWW